MVGFVYSLPGIKDGEPTQWSHMAACAGPRARPRAAAEAAQRDAALAMGLDLIEWTYDPLQAMNAHLNFAKLGVVVEEYAENIYGESSSPLHAARRPIASSPSGGSASRTSSGGSRRDHGPSMRDTSIAARAGRQSCQGSRAVASPWRGGSLIDARRLLVEIPVGFSEMLERDRELALEWRLSTRQIFQHYFARGYRAVDFFLAREAGKGQYLLAQPAG